jgi:sensor c-di-GMP phosphodiesterase-like protein
VAITTLAACGVVGGYFLARWITAQITEIRLDNYASQLMTNGENSAAELREALTAVDASPYPVCSPAEIQYFNALIDQSAFIIDTGHMNDDGQIQCSAKLGRPAQLGNQLNPDFTQQDGTQIYKGLTPYRDNSLTAITLQRNHSFVVYTPLARMYIEPAPLHFTETVTDAPTQRHGLLLGESLLAGPEILSTEGKDWLGDKLYATRCSIRFFSCVTAFTSLPEIVASARTRFVGCMVSCGLFGALVGLLLSLLYRRNKAISKQLRRAIRKGDLWMLYQPIVDLESGRIAGAEALARWANEDGIPVSPDVFVHVAEENGFVCELTQWVLRRVLADFATTLRENPDFRVSINVTADDLNSPAFLLTLEGALAYARVRPQSLTIEITESSAVRHEAAIHTIHALREHGHKVHIDDFGTGYSSLSYLQDLAVDAIKIDRSFTQSIGTGAVTITILPQILAIAKALNLNVVAEGIETDEQAKYFADAKQSVLAQGWLFGRPMPAEVLQRLMADNTRMLVEKASAPAAVESVA